MERSNVKVKVLVLLAFILCVFETYAVTVYTDTDVETSKDVSGFFECGDAFRGYFSRPADGKCVVVRDCWREKNEKRIECDKWKKTYSFSEYVNHRAGRLVEIEKIVWKTDQSNEAKLFYKEAAEKVVIESDFVPWDQSPMNDWPFYIFFIFLGSIIWDSVRRR